jgi:hypothetical protein
MTEEYYKSLNAELGAEFDLFALENPAWMSANVPPGAVVVMQTDDSGFNAWAQAIAQRNRPFDQPPGPSCWSTSGNSARPSRGLFARTRSC